MRSHTLPPAFFNAKHGFNGSMRTSLCLSWRGLLTKRNNEWHLPVRIAPNLVATQVTPCDLAWKQSICQRASPSTRASASAIQSPIHETVVQNTNAIPLPLGEVHIWWLEADEVHSSELLQQYLALLPKAEQQYVAEGASEAVRKERTLARTLVRSVLTRYCEKHTPMEELLLQTSPSGKPCLVSDQGKGKQGDQLHFNLTHTERLLGVAVSRGGLVGLDAEDTGRLTRASPVDLARRRFSPREFAVLTGFENLAEQQRLFIRLWCLKEAYIKATGRGIMAPPGLAGFTFELLLNIKVRPSKRRPQSLSDKKGPDKENVPPQLQGPDASTPQPRKYSLDEQQASRYSLDEQRPSHSMLDASSGGVVERGRERTGDVWGPQSRAAFSLQFHPPLTDEPAWEAWLMELCGGHTAALVVESGKQTDSVEEVESRTPVCVKCFKTVPLMSEEMMSSYYCRVIGHGHSVYTSV